MRKAALFLLLACPACIHLEKMDIVEIKAARLEKRIDQLGQAKILNENTEQQIVVLRTEIRGLIKEKKNLENEISRLNGETIKLRSMVHSLMETLRIIKCGEEK